MIEELKYILNVRMWTRAVRAHMYNLICFQDDTGHKIRPQKVADRRDRQQDRPALLPLLSTYQRDELPARGLFVLRGDTRSRLLQPRS